MTYKLASAENFDIVRGKQTVRVPFASTEPQSETTVSLARLADIPAVINPANATASGSAADALAVKTALGDIETALHTINNGSSNS